jgi:hypothetical protein
MRRRTFIRLLGGAPFMKIQHLTAIAPFLVSLLTPVTAISAPCLRNRVQAKGMFRSQDMRVAFCPKENGLQLEKKEFYYLLNVRTVKRDRFRPGWHRRPKPA